MVARESLFLSFNPTRRLMVMTLLFICGVSTGTVGADADPQLPYGPGLSELTVSDDRLDRPLVGHIWYPTATPEKMSRTGTSRVWKMPLSDPDGEAAPGRFPLLVVSHGMYGNVRNQAWLASELSRRGFIVAMVNHPGTSTFLRDGDQARQLWDRPVDLSRLITYLVHRSGFRESIDPDRIYAAGHSLGGFTVMLSAGAVFDNERYRSGCFGGSRIPVVCDILEGWSVALSETDQGLMSRSYKDKRIRKVVSLDLGGTPVLSRRSLAAIDIPILVLGSGRADMLDQSLESRALAAGLPENLVRHIELDYAGHFDFMGVCTPEGFAILEENEPGDEMVCVKGGEEREEQHRRILEVILTFLDD